MSQFIKLEEIVLHAMIFEVGRDNIGMRVVRRMLNRTKVRHILVLRDDHETARMLREGDCPFHILSTPEGALKDFIFLRPQQYGSLMVVRECATASAALDEFYAGRDLRARMKQRANDLFKLIMTRTQRASRKLENQRQELAETDKRGQNKLYGDLISGNIGVKVVRQSLGVFAGVAPFNFPAPVFGWFIPYAIVAGNTFIFKPSTQSPYFMQMMCEIFQEIGLPAGVVNVIHGHRSAHP